MVKVEIRPGIFIRLTEEEARKRGFLNEALPSNKAAEPTKAKKADKPKAEAPTEEAAETEDEASE